MSESVDYIEMTLDALRDIDNLFLMEFTCGNRRLSLLTLLQFYPCPWAPFVRSYLDAVYEGVTFGGYAPGNGGVIPVAGKRKALLNAACKGVNGLDLLISTLARKI